MASPTRAAGIETERPELHLSGPKLRAAYERLVGAAERIGGIEAFASTVALKSRVFQDRLGDGKATSLARAEFAEMVPLMATVRRRIGPLMDSQSWPRLQAAIADLLADAHDTTLTDNRIARFESALSSPSPHRSSRWGEGRGEGQQPRSVQAAAPHPDPLPAEGAGRGKLRFLRDLSSELLHNTYPEHYPLMHRWVWDTKANTGVLREIWHDTGGAGDNTDSIVIDVPDGYETFLCLREEISQFLSQNGVFRDMLWHVDLVCAQVYGDYIGSQGGAWLKTDFGSESDPIEHTRRIVGLDRIGRKRTDVSGEIAGGMSLLAPSDLGSASRPEGASTTAGSTPTPSPSPQGVGELKPNSLPNATRLAAGSPHPAAIRREAPQSPETESVSRQAPPKEH